MQEETRKNLNTLAAVLTAIAIIVGGFVAYTWTAAQEAASYQREQQALQSQFDNFSKNTNERLMNLERDIDILKGDINTLKESNLEILNILRNMER